MSNETKAPAGSIKNISAKQIGNTVLNNALIIIMLLVAALCGGDETQLFIAVVPCQPAVINSGLLTRGSRHCGLYRINRY